MTRTRGRREYAGEALAERGRSGAESRANKPISLGSPIQTAGMKIAVFLYFPKRSASSNVVNLKIIFWEVFTNSFM